MLTHLDHALITAIRELTPAELEQALQRDILPLDRQDKRSVVAIERGDIEQWLHGSVDDAGVLMRPPAIEVIDAGPAAE